MHQLMNLFAIIGLLGMTANVKPACTRKYPLPISLWHPALMRGLPA